MNKIEMIKAIYEKIADKTLSFGCKIKVDDYEGTFLKQSETGKIQYWNKNYLYYSNYENSNPIIAIIGHQVMIGDVLDYIYKNIKNHFVICKECGNNNISTYTIDRHCPFTGTDLDGVERVYYCDKCGWDSQVDKYYEDYDRQYMAIDDLIIGNGTINGGLWKEKRKPIEEQSDETINYIYNLIK